MLTLNILGCEILKQLIVSAASKGVFLRNFFFFLKPDDEINSGSVLFTLAIGKRYQVGTVADLGGGGVRLSPLRNFDPLPTQRVPLCTILRYPFLAD